MPDLTPQEQYDQLAAALEDTRREMLAVLKPVVDVVMRAVAPVYDAFHRAYIEAGAPNGDTDEGFNEWLRQLSPASDDDAD